MLEQDEVVPTLRPPTLRFWTPAREARLREMFAQGATGTQIKRELGCTRSAVMGKLARLGLRRDLPKKVKEPKPPKQRKDRSGGRRSPLPRQPNYAPLMLVPKPTGLHRCGILDLTNTSCRWPYGDSAPYMFCGDPTADLAAGRPYCPAHTRDASVPKRVITDESRERMRIAFRKRFLPSSHPWMNPRAESA